MLFLHSMRHHTHTATASDAHTIFVLLTRAHSKARMSANLSFLLPRTMHMDSLQDFVLVNCKNIFTILYLNCGNKAVVIFENLQCYTQHYYAPPKN